ncbi:MAG: DUF2336 domain-containing protein, partial [Rhodospirillales bacterium]
ARTAVKIAGDFSRDALNDTERKLAEDIFRLMAKDAEVQVREALSQHLKNHPGLPHDVALALARDVDSVSLPVLEFSSVLTEEDLIMIVRDRSEEKQTAIAKRPELSIPVSSALVDNGSETVVTALMANETAEIADAAFEKAIDAFGDSPDVQEALVERMILPVTVMERLMTIVADSLKERLAQRHDLAEDTLADMLLQSRERAVMSLSGRSSHEQLLALVRHLHRNGRLTPSLIVRSLCMGDVNFFEAALAEMTRLSLADVHGLMHDSGESGVSSLYEKAGLPAAHLPAVNAALSVIRETGYDGGEDDIERFARRMIERVLTQHGEELGVTFDAEDMAYLLRKMGQLPANRLGRAV